MASVPPAQTRDGEEISRAAPAAACKWPWSTSDGRRTSVREWGELRRACAVADDGGRAAEECPAGAAGEGVAAAAWRGARHQGLPGGAPSADARYEPGEPAVGSKIITFNVLSRYFTCGWVCRSASEVNIAAKINISKMLCCLTTGGQTRVGRK